MKHYLTLWLATTMALVLVVAAFNVAVDPYGLFRLIDRSGFNSIKPAAATHGAMTKAYQLVRVKPKILVLGNSRAELGLDPAHPALAAQGPVYNAALPGTGVKTSLRFLQHALASNASNPADQVKVVVWGIDFMDFLTDAAAPRHAAVPGKDDGRLLGPDNVHATQWQQQSRDYLITTLTLTALLDSVHTLASQTNPYAVDLTPLGFNPMHDYIKISSDEGYWNVFRQKDQANAKALLRRPKDIFDASGHSSQEFDDLKEVMRLCRQHGVKLQLFTYPYHAHLLEIIRITGHWPAFDAWKRTVVKILADEASLANRSAFEFWDFSAFNSLTSETIPAKGDRKTRMRYYWESGHFKKELGDLMLDRMLRPSAPHAEFGTLLTPSELEDQISHIKAQGDEYRKTHHQEIDELVGLTAKATSGKIK